ncbi:MAG: hypothetical protein IKV03_05355 [Alphaproteobacteria bacterium]|nr:hypothetical protein [Alphaproteobacteria bacterium]
MKHHTFLHTFFKPPYSQKNLVVIPSSCSVSKPPIEYYNDKTEKQRLINKASEACVTLTLPYDDNIFCGKWCYLKDETEYTHPPQLRAAMLFEVICAQTKRGYKYQFVYLTDGYGSQEVLNELQKIIQINGTLPKRAKTLKIYGFDDAIHILTYLGIHGICTPIYYSKGLWALLNDIAQPSSGACLLKPLNLAAKSVQYLSGHILPDIMHPEICQCPQKQHNTHFIISELDTASDMNACLKWASCTQTHNIVFVLSKDTNPIKAQILIQYISSNIPVFSGAPVGHGYCLNQGQPITLFAPAVLAVPEEFSILSWMDTSDFSINL